MQLLQYLINGVAEGAVLSLIALGLTLTFAIVRFANVAHGEYVTMGAYLTLFFNQILKLPLHYSVLCAIPLAVATGLIVNVLVFKPISNRSGVTSMIASIGVTLVLRHVIILIAGTRQYGYAQPLMRPLRFGSLRVAVTDLWIIGIAAAVVVLLILLLHGTQLGRHMRAVADNEVLARVGGINPRHVITAMWAIALTLAVIAGAMAGVKSIVQPYTGWNLLIGAFAAMILGGIGSPLGAVLGGLTIGVAQEMTTLVLPPTYKIAVSFMILTFFLLFRPQGLLGEKRLLR